MDDIAAAGIVERKRRARAESIKKRAEAHAGCAEAAGLALAINAATIRVSAAWLISMALAQCMNSSSARF